MLAGSNAAQASGGSAAHRAYAYVKERLLDGRFAGGTLLSENELAHRLGFSRTPVRQAFVQLEVEGLGGATPKRGPGAPPPGPGFPQWDRRFPRAIVEAAGNALLLRQYDALRD